VTSELDLELHVVADTPAFTVARSALPKRLNEVQMRFG
jgi:hypothetical protein